MKIDRLISIILLLLDKPQIRAHELAEIFEVSPRTIYRDLDAINLAGIPLTATSGPTGGYRILENYKLQRNVFSRADLSAILTGLTGLSDIIRGEELINALAKVKSFIPAEQARELELQTQQISIDLSPWLGNRRIQPYLSTVKTALQENKLLSFDYTGRYGQMTTRLVEPYQLVLKDSHWYFQAYCRNRQDYRLFKIARVSALQMREETFVPRDFRKPQLDFSEIWGPIQKDIVLRIDRCLRERILDYCDPDNFTADGPQHYLVNFPFIENDYNYDLLLSFGAKCECLKPLGVRQELKRRIQDLLKLYRY